MRIFDIIQFLVLLTVAPTALTLCVKCEYYKLNWNMCAFYDFFYTGMHFRPHRICLHEMPTLFKLVKFLSV